MLDFILQIRFSNIILNFLIIKSESKVTEFKINFEKCLKIFNFPK